MVDSLSTSPQQPQVTSPSASAAPAAAPQVVSEYAGFGRRFVGYFIDALIFVVVGSFIPKENTGWYYFIYVLLWTAYYVWMIGQYGATVGKMITKQRVVKEDESKVGYSDALLREIVSYLSFIVLGLGYLSIIWDKRKQGWHDKIGGTLVVKA